MQSATAWHGDRLAAARGVDALVGLALDAHASDGDAERLGQVRAHRVDVRPELRALERSTDDVHVADLETRARTTCRRAARAGPGSTRPSTADRYRESDGRCRRQPRRQESRRSPRGTRRRRPSARAAPRSNGIVHAAEDRAGGPRPGDAGRSRCRRASAAGDPAARAPRNRFGHGQVLGRRDLDVRRLALDEPHRVAGALGERRLVGRVDAALRRAPARRAALAPKRLGRLREVDRLARQRFDDERVPVAGRASPCRAPAAPPARRPLSTAAAIVREIRSALANGRAASWITTTSLVVARGLERVRHRILPPRAAGDDPHRLRRGTQIRRRIGGQLGRQRDDDVVDRRDDRGRASTLRSRIGRPPTVSSCLGTRAAEALAAAAGRDDRRHLHVMHLVDRALQVATIPHARRDLRAIGRRNLPRGHRRGDDRVDAIGAAPWRRARSGAAMRGAAIGSWTTSVTSAGSVRRRPFGITRARADDGDAARPAARPRSPAGSCRP